MARISALVFILLTAGVADAAAQAPAQSFSALPGVLEVGQRVIVREDGRTSHGKVVSLDNGQLEIEWRRWIFQRRQRLFTENSVRTVALQDSDWNGLFLGAGVGILAGTLIDHQYNNEVWGSPLGSYLGAWIGAFVGEMVDRSVNRNVYVSSRARAVAVVPVLSPHRAGVALTARF